MIHTIQADFYRLFRSKGFWITEFILFTLMLMGASIGATGHLMAIQTEEPDIPTHGWDGVQALINASSQGSNLVFLCIILTCLVLGVDLIGKLYKNSLTVGVLVQSFLCQSLCSSLYCTFATYHQPCDCLYSSNYLKWIWNYAWWLLLAIYWQPFSFNFFASLLGLSIVSFILYVSHSYLAVFIGYLVSSILLSMPMLIFQISKFCHIYHYSLLMLWLLIVNPFSIPL